MQAVVARDLEPRRAGPRDELFAARTCRVEPESHVALGEVLNMCDLQRLRVEPKEMVRARTCGGAADTPRRENLHLNARCDEEWWVELADECEERGTYAKLSRWLYLMRKAAWAWEDDNALKLTLHRSRRCRTALATFFHPETQVTVVGHGDDFTCAGTELGLGKIRPKLWYDVKRRGFLGSGEQNVSTFESWARTLGCTERGLECEAGDEHRQVWLRGLGSNEESQTVQPVAMRVEKPHLGGGRGGLGSR